MPLKVLLWSFGRRTLEIIATCFCFGFDSCAKIKIFVFTWNCLSLDFSGLAVVGVYLLYRAYKGQKVGKKQGLIV